MWKVGYFADVVHGTRLMFKLHNTPLSQYTVVGLIDVLLSLIVDYGTRSFDQTKEKEMLTYVRWFNVCCLLSYCRSFRCRYLESNIILPGIDVLDCISDPIYKEKSERFTSGHQLFNKFMWAYSKISTTSTTRTLTCKGMIDSIFCMVLRLMFMDLRVTVKPLQKLPVTVKCIVTISSLLM